MILIVCVDDSWGLMFNNRRQSRDRALTERVLKAASGQKLRMSEYSAPLFENAAGAELFVSEDFLENAGPGELCFLEDRDAELWADRAEKLIVYRWNRKYPADRFFGLVSNGGWALAESTDFAGYSHERITEEIYLKAAK